MWPATPVACQTTSLFSYLYFVFCWGTKVTQMCEVVTVLARGIGTCVACHPSGVPDNIRFPILFLGCYSHGSAYCETTFAVEMHCWCRWRSWIAALTDIRTICAVECPSGASTLPMREMGASWSLAATMTAGTQQASVMTTHTPPWKCLWKGKVCIKVRK